MSDYTVEIEGKHSLEQINLQISGEEAGASEFISSSIEFYEGQITNLAKFKEIAPGTIPKTLTLVKHDEEQPANTVEVWTGVMIVTNKNEVVSAYRAT